MGPLPILRLWFDCLLRYLQLSPCPFCGEWDFALKGYEVDAVYRPRVESFGSTKIRAYLLIELLHCVRQNNRMLIRRSNCLSIYKMSPKRSVGSANIFTFSFWLCRRLGSENPIVRLGPKLIKIRATMSCRGPVVITGSKA